MLLNFYVDFIGDNMGGICAMQLAKFAKWHSLKIRFINTNDNICSF